MPSLVIGLGPLIIHPTFSTNPTATQPEHSKQSSSLSLLAPDRQGFHQRALGPVIKYRSSLNTGRNQPVVRPHFATWQPTKSWQSTSSCQSPPRTLTRTKYKSVAHSHLIISPPPHVSSRAPELSRWRPTSHERTTTPHRQAHKSTFTAHSRCHLSTLHQPHP